MFDCYQYYKNSAKYCKNVKNKGKLYFVAAYFHAPLHYENMPVQYAVIFKFVKNENFQ